LSNSIKEDKAKRLKKLLSKKEPGKRKVSTAKERGLLKKKRAMKAALHTTKQLKATRVKPLKPSELIFLNLFGSRL